MSEKDVQQLLPLWVQVSFPGEKCGSLKQGNGVPDQSEKLENKTETALLLLLRAFGCVACFGFLRINTQTSPCLVLDSPEGARSLASEETTI